MLPPDFLCALCVLSVQAFEFLRDSHTANAFHTENTEGTK
jgi:hypothetical protein